MEFFVKAPRDGVIDKVNAAEGDAVQMKQELITLERQTEATE